ncbi:hypothetical protein I302_100731 [Kwoniella bestiolae CBS 10118]|uniref:Uncharacterized protein n=1 Tax=Kwoniella bestiolae CBS 10118 TaxID=1296100 RepID=A0A1B9G5Z3_9TREE|nr:hypothetical protein I302_04106 [Kwoniella bestiolae CBS 10118]OCF26421.1 hypothetical protein I302_04106 [Kwoniella bestiolae CBS 10118]
MPLEPITIPLSPRTPSALLSSLILSPRPEVNGITLPQSLMGMLSPTLPSSFPPNTSPSHPGEGVDLPRFPLPPSPAPYPRQSRTRNKENYRSLTTRESQQLASILLSSLKPHKKNPKELMRASIELASKLDGCGIKWDKQRKVMGIHLRGLYEIGLRGGEGMEMYVQGSFVTTAEEPHPLDPSPLPLPLSVPAQTQNNNAIPKHAIQAGLLSALPINPDSSSSPIPRRSPEVHNRQNTSINSIKSILSRPTSTPLHPLHADTVTQPPGILSPSITISTHQNIMPLTTRPRSRPGLSINTNLTSPEFVPSSRAFTSFGETRPGFELHEGLRADAKVLERERKIQKWRERKKRVGLRIRIDNHKSRRTPHSAISHRSTYYSARTRTARTPRTGHTAFTALTPQTAYTGTYTPYTAHTPYTPARARGRAGTPRYPHGPTPHPPTPRYRREVPHQTGRYQTNLIQPYSAISFRIPSPPLSGIIRSAHSLTNTYRKKKQSKFGFSLNLNLKLGSKIYSFGNNTEKRKRPRSGRKMGFGGWELR